jgi:hypothetical protein
MTFFIAKDPEQRLISDILIRIRLDPIIIINRVMVSGSMTFVDPGSYSESDIGSRSRGNKKKKKRTFWYR